MFLLNWANANLCRILSFRIMLSCSNFSNKSLITRFLGSQFQSYYDDVKEAEKTYKPFVFTHYRREFLLNSWSPHNALDAICRRHQILSKAGKIVSKFYFCKPLIRNIQKLHQQHGSSYSFPSTSHLFVRSQCTFSKLDLIIRCGSLDFKWTQQISTNLLSWSEMSAFQTSRTLL